MYILALFLQDQKGLDRHNKSENFTEENILKNYRYIERRNRLIRKIALWVGEVVGVILLAWILVHFCVEVLTIHGNSMQTAYNDGDVILMNKLDYRLNDPRRYYAAVFELENGSAVHYTLKRVVGLPGEKIQIKEGKIYVNGECLDKFGENILSPGLAAFEITLKDDEYFVIGDNYNNSEDSRVANIGNIKRSQFAGKAVITLHHEK